MDSASARESALGLAWSLWTELGVPGPHRRHSHAILDPERLILATPWLARDDARLLDLAFAWCVQHAHRVSSTRMTGLLRDTPKDVRLAAEPFFGELAAEGVHLMRVAARPPARPRDHRKIVVPVERPGLLRLRVRALVGVSGRADVLVALLATPERWVSASQLDDVAIAKRNVARILSELAESGIAHARQRGNLHEFRLSNPAALGAVVAVPPHAVFPAWGPIFEWMRLADELATLPHDRPATLRVEVAGRRPDIGSLSAALGLIPPNRAADAAPLIEWVTRTASAIADGSGPPWGDVPGV